MKCTSGFLEELSRCSVVESFSRSIVEFLDDVVQVALGEGMQVGFLGDVLAEQAVGVFVCAALPGAVGIGEVDVGVEVFLDGFEVGEFVPLSSVMVLRSWLGTHRKALRMARPTV